LPLVQTSAGEVRAQHSTDLLKNNALRAVIGDSVLLQISPGQDTPQIIEILPRKTVLARRSMVESIHEGSGKFLEQVLAANIDLVLIAAALGTKPLDPAYLERQLVVAHQSGAAVAVVLTKKDLAKHLDADVDVAKQCIKGAPLVVHTAQSGEGLELIRQLIGNGVAALLGRSGVGKSTLVNELCGMPLLRCGKVRQKDHAGRHTTVARKLIYLPSGGAIIDAPGMRSLGLYAATDGLSATFPEIIAAAADCRYRDCTHQVEPGCNVLKAVEKGAISERRLSSYVAISAEVWD
jgi:ribosome biogenesis GTPase